jgi:hypothetical protein
MCFIISARQVPYLSCECGHEVLTVVWFWTKNHEHSQHKVDHRLWLKDIYNRLLSSTRSNDCSSVFPIAHARLAWLCPLSVILWSLGVVDRCYTALAPFQAGPSSEVSNIPHLTQTKSASESLPTHAVATALSPTSLARSAAPRSEPWPRMSLWLWIRSWPTAPRRRSSRCPLTRLPSPWMHGISLSGTGCLHSSIFVLSSCNALKKLNLSLLKRLQELTKNWLFDALLWWLIVDHECEDLVETNLFDYSHAWFNVRMSRFVLGLWMRR